MQYGLIGEKLGHSFSKELHEKLEDYTYTPVEIPADELGDFMKKKDFKAINVTIPYKESVIEYLDYISDRAKNTGAVNTIVQKDGKLYGYNTDCLGMMALFEKNKISLKDKKVIITGTGATSKTALSVARELGAKMVLRVGRQKKPDCITYDELYRHHSDAEVLINTTPCGMYPDCEGTPVDIDKLPRLGAVADVIYNPLRTSLISSAKKKGIKTASGLFMLVSQAMYAIEKFVSRPYDAQNADITYESIKADKENIVLIGMPSSGKSSIGRALCEKTGREVIDIDEMIIQKHKMPIPEIFEKYGEDVFRQWESECICEASCQNGKIIATGGGAVLIEKNVDRLKQNGKLYFIDRPLKDLVPTPDRPLSMSKEALEMRYRQRYPIYKAAADETVANTKDIESVCAQILSIHNGVKRHMHVKIEPSKASGTVKAPPSKSIAHRLLICSGLSGGKSRVYGIAPSEDVLATLDCLKALGAKFSFEGDSVIMEGVDPHKSSGADLNCRESGSTLRFFLPLCLLSGESYTLSGSETLLSRPMSVYEDLCRERGFSYSNDGSKISVSGTLTGGSYRVKGNISSQFISGLLFALPLLDADSTISIAPPIESLSYINLTIGALKEFGVEVRWEDERTLYIRGGQSYKPCEVSVEGDFSNAAFFEALNVMGGDVTIEGLPSDSLQGDRVYPKFYEMLQRGTPTIHLSDCPDLGPVLFALAACKNGGIFTGTRRLKIKESDRAAAMADELRKFGVSVSVSEDSVCVYPADFHKPTRPLCGHNDHRIVMALSVLSTLTGATIEGAEAVAKSMPDFFYKLKSVGVKVIEYADNK